MKKTVYFLRGFICLVVFVVSLDTPLLGACKENPYLPADFFLDECFGKTPSPIHSDADLPEINISDKIFSQDDLSVENSLAVEQPPINPQSAYSLRARKSSIDYGEASSGDSSDEEHSPEEDVHATSISIGEIKLFTCSYCDYRSYRSYRITQHERKHTGEKPFKCKKCAYRATLKQVLAQHIKQHHTKS